MAFNGSKYDSVMIIYMHEHRTIMSSLELYNLACINLHIGDVAKSVQLLVAATKTNCRSVDSASFTVNDLMQRSND